MWGEEMERSPVLGAPGSNDYCGLIAGSTNAKSGSEASNFQGLSNEDANDLCERYLPLAYKMAGKYRNRGVDPKELQSASQWGLGRVLIKASAEPLQEVSALPPKADARRARSKSPLRAINRRVAAGGSCSYQSLNLFIRKCRVSFA